MGNGAMIHQELLNSRFPSVELAFSQFRDNYRVVVPNDHLVGVLSCLKADGGFDLLSDITAVDYLEYEGAEQRFGVVYILVNNSTGERVIVKTFVDDPDPALPSMVPLWKAADWLEREIYDMFGISFIGHPDLRRILMPDEFTAFPLRKDYPLKGRGERHNFPVITRAES
ncbi:MAG TPA: NADH-quinone oxidoreductase subunit C [Planctomycetaceae bacterium]|nr:NADH-quinone oxidoreductase subunit C [Planctomycetaceae bacterium]